MGRRGRRSRQHQSVGHARRRRPLCAGRCGAGARRHRGGAWRLAALGGVHAAAARRCARAARQGELADLLAREEGKPLAEAKGEVLRAAHIFKFFAGEALRVAGELVASTRPGLSVEITREPVGVVTIITPWNFPIAIPAWKIAPALAYGNAVVFKPADLVPGCAWALAEMLSRAGLPLGTFNLVMGRGRDVGDTLLTDPRVAAISFTGSQATGRKVARASVE